MINRVILVGRITKDAEIKKTQSGISSCRFTLAVDKKDGADFINCQSWRQSACWKPSGGVVLDSFFGSGTTGRAATRLGREYVGIELNEDYIKISDKRTNNVQIQLL